MVFWPQQKCGRTGRIPPAEMWVIGLVSTVAMKCDNLASVLSHTLCSDQSVLQRV
jgi:hypothetical protein